jgi:hypothetical protein
VTDAANAATLTAGTVAVDVLHIAGNYVTGAWHFYDLLSCGVPELGHRS